MTNTPEKVAGLWRQYVTDSSWFEAGREQLVVFTLDTRHRCTGYFLISVGTINESLAHPREILRPVIMSGAYGFVLMHNHPSGDSTPSEADRALTRRIREAADLLQIHLLDHVIMGEVAPERGQVTGFFSFKEHGLL
jgi:DNA repair protein RadC